MRFRILKFSSLFLVLVVISFGVFVFVKAQAPAPLVCGDGIVQSPNDAGEFEKCDEGTGTGDAPIPVDTERCTAACGQKMLGWAWISGAGWVSLNDDNCNGIQCDSGNCGDKYVEPDLLLTCSVSGGRCFNDGDCTGGADLCTAVPLADICPLATQNYYTQVTSANKIEGFAWSPSIGWLCFGSSCCSGAACNGTWPNLNNNCSLQNNGVEAVLDFDNPSNPQVLGWAQAYGMGDDGWFSLNYRNQTASCAEVTCSDYDGNQTTCNAAGCVYDTLSDDCDDYKTRLTQDDFGGTCSILTTKKCDLDNSGSCDPATDFYCCDTGTEGNCVGEQRPTLGGWAWNDNDTTPGLGWLQFDPEVDVIPPWLQTKYGDIYAQRGFRGENAPGYNATYLILSGGGVVNFLSARGSTFVDPTFGEINFPTPETRYTNALGKLDVDGVLCDGVVSDGDPSCVNQYGKTVIDLATQPLSTTQLLDGKIYYYGGDLVIGSSIEFQNGDLNSLENGAGTIIVDGKLTINQDITYEASANLTKFRNLATVAFVVLGDLEISPNVGELAGNFIVIGDGTTNCDPDPDVDTAADDGCGQIYSCFGAGDCSAKRLNTSGLMMGRKFYFTRTFIDPNEAVAQGSEVIVYDGRLLANTPPGLGDFVKSLPIWRSGTLSQ